MHLFTYGTLMFPEVWDRLAIGEFASVPATLPNYAVYRVRDAVFPGLVAVAEEDPPQAVEGMIYLDLDQETLFELDTYESDLYDRVAVSPVLASGKQIACEAYVIPSARRAALTSQPWCPDEFKAKQLQRYLYG